MTTTRAAFAACLFAAFVAGWLVPGFASAHRISEALYDIATRHPGTVSIGSPRTVTPERPTNFRVNGIKADYETLGTEFIAGRSHNAIVVSWDAKHGHAGGWWRSSRYDGRHYRYTGHYLFVYPENLDIMSSHERRLCLNAGYGRPVEGCIRRFIPLGNSGFADWSNFARADHFVGASYSVTVSGLTPSTRYRITLAPGDNTRGRVYFHAGQAGTRVDGRSHSATVITAAAPPGYEPPTPTEPETPTEPTTPTTTAHSHPLPAHVHPYAATVHAHPYAEAEHVHDEVPEHTHEPAEPETPEEPETCTYEHRFTGVPGTTANAYIGQIRISSKAPNATATLRAYQADNGHRIDVLDTDGRAVETVSLAPARSVKRFRIEGIRGWHPVTVEHPSESAMQAATVALRIREPDGSIEDSYPLGIKHCEPTTGPVTETGTPPPATAPDLAVRDAQALLWTATLDWRATVENIGDGPAPETSIRLYYGERELAAQDVRRELAAGDEWPMSHAVNRSTVTVLRAGSQVRVCVDPVPGEPESKRANNCATVTVESN